MKIAIDLRAMDGASRFRGIGIYIVFLLNNMLPKLLKNHDVSLYVYDEKNLVDIDSNLLAACEIIKATPSSLQDAPGLLKKVFLGVLPREYKRDSALPGVERHDVFFQPYHEMGIPKSMINKTVVTSYDLIPLIFEREYYRRTKLSPNPKAIFKYVRQSAQRRTYVDGLKELNKASHVIAISDSTKKDLHKHLSIPNKNISTIHLGGPEIPKTKPSSSFVKKLGSKPYITYVGGIDSRRPIDKFLLHSGDIFVNQGIRTIVAGHDFEEIRDPSLRRVVEGGIKSGAIVVFGHITEAEKDVLITKAVAFVYPTLYEGFGIPILEAFMRRTPVVTYKNSSITEVAGDAALYIKSLDEVEAAISKLSANKRHRDEVIKQGVRQARKFSWKTCSDQTISVLESVANENA